ncbi:MAG: divergent polysaccharide deacetylase family protein [Treponema sp.]|nr:divergent polysaccharide deacetylase family protein [Treponema sp.]
MATTTRRTQKKTRAKSSRTEPKIAPTKKQRAAKRKKIVLSQMQTALICVVIVAACFILLIVNARKNPRNIAVEQQLLEQPPAASTRNAHASTQPAVSSQTQSSANELQSQSATQPQGASSIAQAQATARPATSQSQVIATAPAASQSAVQAQNVATQTQRSATSMPQSTTQRGTAAGTSQTAVTAPTASQSAATTQTGSVAKPASVQSVSPQSTSVQPTSPQFVSPSQSSAQSPQLPNIPAAVNGAKLVFVFDDAGQNLSQLEKYLSLPFPITVAVLPKLAHSKASADRIRASGNEVMLHQPMQAINLNVNPGPGAITPDMQSSAIAALVKENIAEIGPVAGVNNHEGSLITEDEIKIGAVMSAAKESGAFFMDSRTTSQTRVPQASMELGIPYYERNVFLDNTKNRSDIIAEVVRALNIANANGAVIMIGHVWSADVLPAILLELYPVLKSKGYTFTTVSKSGAIKHP